MVYGEFLFALIVRGFEYLLPLLLGEGWGEGFANLSLSIKT